MDKPKNLKGGGLAFLGSGVAFLGVAASGQPAFLGVAMAMIRVAQIAIDFPEVAELDINPLLADADGVVAIPQAHEARVLQLAFEKVGGEKRTLADLQRGDRLGDVFARYGIL